MLASVGKKGQDAIEYVTVFAAVLVVALIIIFLFGSWQEVGQKSLYDRSRAYWMGMRPIAILDVAVLNYSTAIFLLKNQENRVVNISDIWLSFNPGNGYWPSLINYWNSSLNPGEIKEVPVRLPPYYLIKKSGKVPPKLLLPFFNFTNVSSEPIGYVELYIVINYTYGNSTVIYSEVGTMPYMVYMYVPSNQTGGGIGGSFSPF